MCPRLLSLGAAFLFASITTAQTVITPYTDGQCTKPVGNYTWQDQLDVNFTIQTGWPNADGWQSPVFPGAAAADNAGGYTVYWSIPDPDPSCAFVLMLPYSQEEYGSLGFAAPYGNVILNAQTEGCYYSSIPEGTYLMASFCCGSGDCSNYAAGDAALYKRTLVEETTSLDLAQRDAAAESTSLTKIAKRSINSVTARASELISSAKEQRGLLEPRDGFDTSGCTTTVIGGPEPQAGQQGMVASPQTCTSATCSFSVAQGVTTSTTLTSETSQSITNTVGASLSFTVGVDLIAEAQTTVGADWSLASMMGSSTSSAVMNSTTTTVTNTIGQALGTTGFVSFTPTYLCWTTTIDCGAGVSQPLDFCQPQFTSNNKALQGDYTVVYTG